MITMMMLSLGYYNDDVESHDYNDDAESWLLQ